MLKIFWKRGEIAPEEQFLLFFTIFYNLILDFCVITRTRFFLRDKRLFEITEVEITRVDCMCVLSFSGTNTGIVRTMVKNRELFFFENELYFWENSTFPLYEFQVVSHL